ncbi:apc13p protein [Sarocladium implicatum]|nr:apc13p protein [Sarocladium implicatum]
MHVNYVVEPTDDGKGTRTIRGPGGYTDDEETWSCLNTCDIKPSDCSSVRTTLQDMGGQDGWWWMPDTAGCNSWQQGNCKATFCPLIETESIDKRDDNDGMRVSAPKLAKHLRLMGAICAEDGRRGNNSCDNEHLGQHEDNLRPRIRGHSSHKYGEFDFSKSSTVAYRLPQNKDSSFTQVHMHRAGDADLFEDFCRDRLPDDEVYVPPQHQPVNPEDEDDVVPDQHAAFGIQRATQGVKEPAWKDLGLGDLMNKGPSPSMGRPSAPSGSKNGRALPR